jgi:hypothetical protein
MLTLLILLGAGAWAALDPVGGDATAKVLSCYSACQAAAGCARARCMHTHAVKPSMHAPCACRLYPAHGWRVGPACTVRHTTAAIRLTKLHIPKSTMLLAGPTHQCALVAILTGTVFHSHVASTANPTSFIMPYAVKTNEGAAVLESICAVQAR